MKGGENMNTIKGIPRKDMMTDIVSAFELRGVKACVDLPLDQYSTFAIGGKCALAVFPKNADELAFSLELADGCGMDSEVVGKGSNILFSDDGYDGMLVFTSQMRQIIHKGDGVICADAGANLTSASVKAAGWGLTGLEFACGIPGSCGGAVYMNAGAYGGEIADVLEYSEYYDTVHKKIRVLHRSEHDFSYRHSIYQRRKDLIITGVGFKLVRAPESNIRSLMDEYTKKRRASQPHEYPNAGSIFKRPESGYAAKMIDDCGLKGLSVGGAQVSEKHAGFIVNRGGATAKDVLALIEIIKEQVYKRFGVTLECEIKIIKQ